MPDGIEVLRIERGQPCVREGTWFSPAKVDSSRYFKVGEIMPVFDISEYGHTIWQWVP
jgi:predicted cupin superfamily sugar epimerase